MKGYEVSSVGEGYSLAGDSSGFFSVVSLLLPILF